MAVPITSDRVVADLVDRYPGIILVDAWGEQSLFYNPSQRLLRGIYFATIKQKDGDNDRASHLNRPGVFRFNLGTPKPLYMARFGHPPARPGKGQVIDGPWDFTALDQLTPHPVYGWKSWVAVLNPSAETFADISPLIEAAFDKAKAALAKKTGHRPL